MEWLSGLGNGLQNRVHGFDSRFHLAPRAFSSAGERFPDTEEVTGSIPVSRTNSPSRGCSAVRLLENADVAQLVAHNLAKVRVASSSLVIRSTPPNGTHRVPRGWRARAFSSAGERFPDTEEVTGSIPVSRTNSPSRGCSAVRLLENADVAQLVAHNLAKVRVASSSLVIRSIAEGPSTTVDGPSASVPTRVDPCLPGPQRGPGAWRSRACAPQPLKFTQ